MPNYSFENYSSCPNTGAQISYATPWTNPLTNSADYFNACSSSSYSVPKAGSGYQFAKSGNAFVGLYTLNGIGSNYKEYVQTQLTSILSSNNYYLVKFYCSSAGVITYATNNIALNFTNTAVNNTGTGNRLNLISHIYKFTNPIITDSLNWTEIMGIYKANGTEQYITVGNFKDDFNTDTFNLGNNNYPGAYYYIDDVSVEPICTPFWSYRDTTVAIGDSVLIGPAITGLNINWYDATGTFITNAPGIYVKPNSPTFYTATEDFCGSIITHTINVGVSPVGLHAHPPAGGRVGVRLYPNPTEGNLKIIIKNLKDKENLNIKVCDVLGKEVLTFPPLEGAGGGEVNLSLQALQNGIYFLSLYQDRRLIITKKIVKE